MTTILEARNITKEFPGVKALDNISFMLEKGQIHALCGENGAGKSTLINVLSGVYPFSSYEGELVVFDKKAVFENVGDAMKQGIGVIHQEISLFNDLTVMENLFVGNEISRHGVMNFDEMRLEARKWLDCVGLENVEPEELIGDLGIGKKQLIEIARILRLSDTKILILDEPTAALTETETEVLLNILRDLRDQGLGIIYISHKLDEVIEISDYVSVIRDGKYIGGDQTGNLTESAIVCMMVGRDLEDMYPKRDFTLQDEIFRIENFSVFEHRSNKPIVKDANLQLKKGEILGMAGLLGAGRTELMSAVFGDKTYKSTGKIFFNGEEIKISSPQVAIEKGIVYLTEDRKKLGIIPTMSVKENMTISQIKMFKSGLSIDFQKEDSYAVKEIKSFGVRTTSIEAKIINLSGGNQQKVLLGRSLIGNTKVLILDEPTRGIDVGAKQEIYEIMNDLVKNGLSIIVISSELPEILGLCDRVVVMHRGVINGVFDNRQVGKLTEEEIMINATGLRG